MNRVVRTWPLLLATGVANLALLLPPPHPLRYLAAFGLLWVLPGLAWSLLLAGRCQGTGAEALLVGLGLGVTTTALLTLSLHYLPGRLAPLPLLVGSDLFILLLTVWAGSAPAKRPRIAGGAPAVVILVILTGALRFLNLGYSEFQGDEGVIMVRAARALAGNDAALFMHQKGPAEILLPMATWQLSGTLDEFWARAPFAWAGLLGVLAVAGLGRRLFGRRAGWWAGWLLAISGYHVAFGRIVQYQSLVLLATATGLLALLRWSREGRDRWLFSAAALLAFAALGHYDAVMALPPALYLLALRLPRLRSRLPLFVAALLGLALLALFYLPFAQSPNFGKTLAYLGGERIGSGGLIYDNLGSSFVLTTVYNSTWYVVALLLLVVGASVGLLRGWWRLLPVALVAGAVLGSVALQNALLPFVVLGLWLGGTLFSRRASHALRVAWLWFGAPFLFFHFVVWDPRTHVLNLFPGACLVAALGIDELWERFEARKQRRSALLLPLLSFALLVLMSYYPFWMFVDHSPEILRTWPTHRSALFPTVYEEIPPFGLFGFPHRAGWKAVGALFQAGKLGEPYASNEEVEVTGWYTRGAERTYCPGPATYLVADRVQDEIPLDQADLKAHYGLWGTVRRDGPTLLRLYRRDAPVDPLSYRLGDLARDFDAATTPEAVLPPPPIDHVPVDAVLGDRIRLLGYRLEQSRVAPGETLELILFWEALMPLEQSYHVFTHLYQGGTMWGQADSIPQCGLWPTLRWQPGEVVADRYRLTLRSDTPAGSIPLTVGMYTLPGVTRLPIRDAGGDPVGDALTLTVVEVAP